MLLISGFQIFAADAPLDFSSMPNGFDIRANVHLGDGSKQVFCLKQTCLQTGKAQKYLIQATRLSFMFFLLNSEVTDNLDEARVGPTGKKITRECGLVDYLLTVSRCSSSHCRLQSCPVWAKTLADSFRPLLQGTKKAQKFDTWYRVVPAHRNWHMKTAGWNWAGFFTEGLETRWQRFGQFLNDSWFSLWKS